MAGSRVSLGARNRIELGTVDPETTKFRADDACDGRSSCPGLQIMDGATGGMIAMSDKLVVVPAYLLGRVGRVASTVQTQKVDLGRHRRHRGAVRVAVTVAEPLKLVRRVLPTVVRVKVLSRVAWVGVHVVKRRDPGPSPRGRVDITVGGVLARTRARGRGRRGRRRRGCWAAVAIIVSYVLRPPGHTHYVAIVGVVGLYSLSSSGTDVPSPVKNGSARPRRTNRAPSAKSPAGLRSGLGVPATRVYGGGASYWLSSSRAGSYRSTGAGKMGLGSVGESSPEEVKRLGAPPTGDEAELRAQERAQGREPPTNSSSAYVRTGSDSERTIAVPPT